LQQNLRCPIFILVTLLPAYISLIPNDSLLPCKWTHTVRSIVDTSLPNYRALKGTNPLVYIQSAGSISQVYLEGS
jgi:hypothetical protein